MRQSKTPNKLLQRWVFYLRSLTALVGFSTFGIAIALPYLFDRHYPTLVAVGFITTALLLFLNHYVLFDLIRCPQCRRPMNRFVSGKKMPEGDAWERLERDCVCYHCGWKIENTHNP